MHLTQVFDIALALLLWFLGEILYRKFRRYLRERKKP
jgi:hypothetical protein